MYNIGTVSTTANSPKITGTGTRWKDNSTLVSVGQIVLIENGSTLIINCIDSIESNTALTLGFPMSVKLTNVKYRILTTMIDSISDGVNKATAQVIASEIFTDIFTELMTGTGIIEFELPNGQKVKLRTENEKNKLLDGKFDKTGGTITGVLNIQGSNDWAGLNITKKDGEFVRLETNASVSDAFLTLSERDVNNKNKSTVYIPKKSGMVALIGDFGLGFSKTSTNLSAKENGFFNSTQFSSVSPTAAFFGFSAYNAAKTHGFSLGARRTQITAKVIESDEVSEYHMYHTGNTTKDSNGNLKAASPIIRVFADHVDPNEEAEGVTLKKLHTGIYQLHGVLGLHSDASWGGINGGITIPCGINQLPLVYALYDVLEKGKQHPFDGRIVEPDEDGDIVLYTTYRKHDLPQNIQYERFKLYPEFLKEVDGEKVELTPGEPCDIPVGHWVDVRVNMPSNSIYNQKQAEAERLAKIEAERLAQEEAKRAAEEAERAEQEAAERKQYGLDDNSVLL
ncbi:hypothetical protein [Providencia rettgeri]|uniref:phage tail fiber protein n=1 Tax=Providencia rettgeri TaxID=587 RepID=UPI0018C5DBDC|nr:hypothetical protein [Providencia rettgeri]MBG5922113.1 hypothetical protein [Providencia rettgeri]